MANENEIVKEYRDIRQDYTWEADIFTTEDEKVNKLKYIINRKLNPIDKTIILMYTEYQSYRKLGKKMGLSHMTIRKEVLRIKRIILTEFTK